MVECLGVFCSFCFKNFKELGLRNQKGCYSAFSLDKSRIADTCQVNFNAHAIYWPFFRTCINLEGFTCARPHTQALLWCVWRIKAADLWGRDAPLKMALSGCRLLLMTPLCTRHDQKEVRSPSGRQPADVLWAAAAFWQPLLKSLPGWRLSELLHSNRPPSGNQTWEFRPLPHAKMSECLNISHSGAPLN